MGLGIGMCTGGGIDIVVYDDDVKFIEFMKNALDKLNMKHKGTLGTPVFFTNKDDVLTYAEEHKDSPIVYLLDIMAGDQLAGHEIARRVKELAPSNLVIYITHFSDRVLSNVYHKLLSFLFIFKDSNRFDEELEVGILAARDTLADKYFVYTGATDILKLRREDIYYFEKVKTTQFTQVVHKGGFALIKISLRDLKKMLDYTFCYASREFLVNTKAIRQIDKIEQILYFEGDVQCHYSRTRRKELFNAIGYRDVQRSSSIIGDYSYGY